MRCDHINSEMAIIYYYGGRRQNVHTRCQRNGTKVFHKGWGLQSLISYRSYVPPVEQVDWDFVRDLLRGDKLVSFTIKCSVCCLKSSKSYWSATYWRYLDSRNTWICQETLKDWTLHTRLWFWQISFSKMDLKRR